MNPLLNEVTEPAIKCLVDRFHACVRRNTVLGPVFDAAITEPAARFLRAAERSAESLKLALFFRPDRPPGPNTSAAARRTHTHAPDRLQRLHPAQAVRRPA